MRIFVSITLASLLVATNAFAGEVSALAPGKPAGVHAAQIEDVTPLMYFGAVAVGIGIAFAVTSNNNNASAAAGTGGGSTITSTGTTA